MGCQNSKERVEPAMQEPAGTSDTAMQALVDKADSGDKDAQFKLGECFDDGKLGFPKCPVQSFERYLQASKQGHGTATRFAAWALKTGTGVTTDMKKAIELYSEAAEKHKDTKAMACLGFCFDTADGVQEDPAAAVKWYTMAAEQGDSVAQVNLALCFEKGRGTEKDMAQALIWHRKAAEQGNMNAYLNVGLYYEKGDGGVAKDMPTANAWYLKAANAWYLKATETVCAQCKDLLAGAAIQPSMQWAPLRHWVVTLPLDKKPDLRWRKRVVHTASPENRLVGIVRVVSTEDNTLEIFDCDEEYQPHLQDTTLLAPCDLVILDTEGEKVAVKVTKVEEKPLVSFVLECGFLFDAVATFYGDPAEGYVEKNYAVKGYGPLSKHSPTGTPTSIRVTSEQRGDLEGAACEILHHCFRELIKEAEKDEYRKLDAESPAQTAFCQLEAHLGFSVAGGGSTGVRGTKAAPSGIADYVAWANEDASPRPLTIFFVEGPADTDFTNAAMTLLKYDRNHLRIVEFSRKSFGAELPSAKMLRQGLINHKKVEAKHLSTVDFVVLEDSDLRLLSTSEKPFGMMHRVLQAEAKGNTSPTYSHRWRFGRGLENYLIPSLAPLALLHHSPQKAFEFSVEAVCKISTEIFWDGKSGQQPWMSGLVATVDLPTRTNLIVQFERKLGGITNPKKFVDFRKELHKLLCELEGPGDNAGDAANLVLDPVTEPVPAAEGSEDEENPSPLQALLQRAAKMLKEQNLQVGSAPHMALCRVDFQAKEDVGLLHDPYFNQVLDELLCALENPGDNAEDAAKLVLEFLTPATAVEDAENPLRVLLQRAAKILFKRSKQVDSAHNKKLCEVLFQAQEAYVNLMANPSTSANEKVSQELFLCGCGCDKLLLVGVDLEKQKPTEGTCFYCGHAAGKHNERFKPSQTIPNVVTGNTKEFYAALCMSGSLWHSHDYMKAVRGESRLGGGRKDPGTGQWTVAALSQGKLNDLCKKHLWWLPQAEWKKMNPKEKRHELCAKELALLDDYSNIQLEAVTAVHDFALDKLCLLRDRQQTEVSALIRRLHVDESAAVKKKKKKEGS